MGGYLCTISSIGGVFDNGIGCDGDLIWLDLVLFWFGLIWVWSFWLSNHWDVSLGGYGEMGFVFGAHSVLVPCNDYYHSLTNSIGFCHLAPFLVSCE